MKKNKKILVTGGAGFIASHIVDAYIKSGYEVIVMDNLSTGLKENLNPKAKFYEVDICNSEEVRKIFQNEKPNIVNHHAAQASVIDSGGDSLGTFKINVLGTINLLSNMSKNMKFIFASTGGAMYSKPEKFPASEEEVPTPLSSYGFSKLLAERSIEEYSKSIGFSYTIFRYSNIFGPRQNPHGEAGIVAIFNKMMRSGERPTIYNKDATRDYVYVSDLVKANIIAIEKDLNDTINISRGLEVNNQTIFDLVARQYNFSEEPIYKPARADELERSFLSSEKAKLELGWEPEISLEEGIKLVYKNA